MLFVAIQSLSPAAANAASIVTWRCVTLRAGHRAFQEHQKDNGSKGNWLAAAVRQQRWKTKSSVGTAHRRKEWGKWSQAKGQKEKKPDSSDLWSFDSAFIGVTSDRFSHSPFFSLLLRSVGRLCYILSFSYLSPSCRRSFSRYLSLSASRLNQPSTPETSASPVEWLSRGYGYSFEMLSPSLCSANIFL